MTLIKYLKSATNRHAVEELLNYRLLFDMKLAAARNDYHLLTYYSDVDHDGFDVIFDDRIMVRKVQLKTFAKASRTSQWQIHRAVLRPTHDTWLALGFFHPGLIRHTDVGVEGGVVLIEYDPNNNDLPVTYYYTDIYAITAIALSHWTRKSRTIAAAKLLRESLPNQKGTDKIGIAKGLFIKLASASHLLAILGLECDERKNWQDKVILSGQRDHWGPKPDMLPSVVEKHISEISDTLEHVSGLKRPA